MNTCEWAIQDRLVHCHHTGEPHNHPPHPKPHSKCKGGNYLRNPAQAVRVFISRFILDCSFSSIEAAALNAGARVCVIYHACHKQVRSSLFIWEGSESRKPSCRSSCCCLRSLHLNLLGSFVRRLGGRTFNLRDKSKGLHRRFEEFKKPGEFDTAASAAPSPQPPGTAASHKSSFLLFHLRAHLIVSSAIKHIHFN